MVFPPVDWSFWVAWYNRILEGRDWHPAEVARILNRLTEDDYKRGPAHVNPMFDPVLRLYEDEDVAALVAATPSGDDVVVDPATERLDIRPTDTPPPEFLPDVLSQVASVRDSLASDGGPNRAYAALSPELRLLDEVLERYSDRPVTILSHLARVTIRIEHRVRNGECPEPDQDPVIEDALATLTQAQVTLIALSPEVRAFAEATKPAAPDETEDVRRGARVVEEASTKALAEEIEKAAQVLEDPEATDEDKRHAFYRLASLISRSYRTARIVLKEASDVTKQSAVVGTALLLVAGNPHVRAAIQKFIQFFLGGGS